MKLFILLMIASVSSFAQMKLPTDSVTGRVCYTKIIRVDSAESKELFGRAKQAFVVIFVSSKAAIQNTDTENGTLSAKTQFETTAKFGAGWGPISYIIKIDVKDNRYKYTLTDFHHSHWGYYTSEKPNGGVESVWKQMCQQIDNNANRFISQFLIEMNKPTPSKEDW